MASTSVKTKGKPCGESFIPRTKRCTKPTTAQRFTPETVSKIALGGAALVGTALLLRNSRRRGWDNPQMEADYQAARAAGELPSSRAARYAGRLDPEVAQLRKERQTIERQVCGARGDTAREDAFTPCRLRIGEASAFGALYKHPNKNVVFKAQNGIAMHVNEREQLAFANQLGVASPKLLDYNDKTRVIAMEYMEGYTPLRLYKSQFPNNPTQRREVAQNLLREAKRMNRAGLAHTDLHLGNVMVNPTNNQVVFVDFGTARSVRLSGREVALRSIRTDLERSLTRATNITMEKPDKIQVFNWMYTKYQRLITTDLRTGQISDLALVQSIDDWYGDLNKVLNWKWTQPAAKLRPTQRI